ncbi:MAG: chemoreceptor glutamine deamidase CheD [Gammaproteobacteria bacterium]|nr:chemoreceptor glutamine deamidase CheD [Gammaproteobacteria bacterium]
MGSDTKQKLPNPLPGFEGINHYWDPLLNMPTAKILPGEYYVTKCDEIITTVLGSCVSACVHDVVAGIGGMNHFMLPISEERGWSGVSDLIGTANRYGNFAMEHMINQILKNGGSRENLKAKIFGGGRIIPSLTDIGQRNVEFVHNYLQKEGLRLISEDIGDLFPRKIVYYPITGRVMVKKLKQLRNDTIVRRERDYRSYIVHKPVEGDVELFDD